jgi:hypothetical protein
MDHDLAIEDILAASFRLSWPSPRNARVRPMRGLLRRMVRACRRQPLQGWPVQLSAPPTRI